MDIEIPIDMPQDPASRQFVELLIEHLTAVDPDAEIDWDSVGRMDSMSPAERDKVIKDHQGLFYG
ncbi:hypothetical protein [Streptomyces jumonjinensis]|uniref:Uncharacterized protein n=1 Tax=Streptomyces jumonjinensis TaxID=1945 RepID=A0A646KS56_STRJU|nr:hypothetical protein [Streptomyces jumonjinensis]MQT03846.1 hypothetical protein [Streptomyces jumonjinensis]